MKIIVYQISIALHLFVFYLLNRFSLQILNRFPDETNICEGSTELKKNKSKIHSFCIPPRTNHKPRFSDSKLAPLSICLIACKANLGSVHFNPYVSNKERYLVCNCQLLNREPS